VLALACGDSGDRPAPGNATAPSKPAAPNQATTPSDAPAPEEVELSPEELAQRGRGIFMSNCIACHNQDPSQAGAVGPEIAGSSLELIEAKVMHNQYPEGYTPKRDSSAMIALPYLEKELPAIHAFLAAAK
jgi:mono/diheme cytochrome c family protein